MISFKLGTKKNDHNFTTYGILILESPKSTSNSVCCICFYSFVYIYICFVSANPMDAVLALMTSISRFRPKNQVKWHTSPKKYHLNSI